MSCGGTTFVWRIAPYGLTNMPAVYSRAMQYVCRVSVEVFRIMIWDLSVKRGRRKLTLIGIV
eukprot:3489954-Pleurochrysis_carterae.AAC.1